MADPIYALSDQTITLVRGQTRSESLTVTSDGTTPVNITGYEVYLTVKNSQNGAILIRKTVGTGIVLTTPASGIFTYTIDAGDTDAWNDGTYYYDIMLETGAGLRYPYIKRSKFVVQQGNFVASQVNVSTYAAEDFVAQQVTGGAMELDGDRVDIDWTPSNYTPDSSPPEAGNVDHLAAHLKGIDTAIGSISVAIGTDLTGLGVDERLARWNGTGTLQSSGWSLSDTDAMVAGGTLDMNGSNLILDADGDTYIDNGTDDTIAFYKGGALACSIYESGIGPALYMSAADIIMGTGKDVIMTDTSCIRDSDDRRFFSFSSVASAANYVQVTNAINTGSPILTGYGATADVGLILDTKGAGEITLHAPTNLGGNLAVTGYKIVTASNGNIDIEPHGTGNVLLGNLTFDADQTVGVGQDNYVLTYDNATGLISLEAASGGGTDLTGLGTDNAIPRWDGTDTLQSSGWSVSDVGVMTAGGALSMGANNVQINKDSYLALYADSGDMDRNSIYTTGGANDLRIRQNNVDSIIISAGIIASKIDHRFDDYVAFSELAAPGTPSANQAYLWLDSTSNNLQVKYDDGTIGYPGVYGGHMGVARAGRVYFDLDEDSDSYITQDAASNNLAFVTDGTTRLSFSAGISAWTTGSHDWQVDRGLIANGNWVTPPADGQTGTVTVNATTTKWAIGCNTTGAAVTVNLPSSPRDGQRHWIYDESANAATYNITINRGGTTTIGTGAATSLVIDRSSAGFELMYDATNTNWKVKQKDLYGARTLMNNHVEMGVYSNRVYTSTVADGDYVGGNPGGGVVLATAGTLRLHADDSSVRINVPLWLDEQAAPSTPAANDAYVWVDSTSNNLQIKYDDGSIGYLGKYGGHLKVAQVNKVYLDDDEDTYVFSNGDDAFRVFVGGSVHMQAGSSLVTIPGGITLATQGELQIEEYFSRFFASELNNTTALGNTARSMQAIETTTNGAWTLTLPPDYSGNIITIIDTGGSCGSSNLTIDPGAGDTIAGAATSLKLTAAYATVTLAFRSSSSTWHIISGQGYTAT